jgi:multiple sugar transport system permease protein
MMLSPVVVGLFWKFMLDTQFGVVNSLLSSLGLGSVEWLTKQRTALFSVILVDTWQWTPFIMLIALAGLTAVPRYLYEAAAIDRASEWFRFRHITLPLVWPLLLIAVLFRAIEAFRLFDLVYILTNGGPGVSTETLSFHVYKVAFLGFDTGTASAYGILMVVVVIILAQVYLRYLEKLREG